MTEARKGVLAIGRAATVWGLSGLYYKALAGCRRSRCSATARSGPWSSSGWCSLAQGRAARCGGLLARPRAWAPLGGERGD